MKINCWWKLPLTFTFKTPRDRTGKPENQSKSVCFINVPGWGAIRKWPLIIRSPTHLVCSQNIITGSGIWFRMVMVWSEVTSGCEWSDQGSLSLSEDGMLRGLDNGLEVVGRCLEYGLISGIFGLGLVWSEVIWRAQSSGQWSWFFLGHGCTIVWQWSDLGLIRGHFRMGMVWSETVWSAHLAHTVYWAHISLIRGYFRLARSVQRSLPDGTSTWVVH